MKFRMKIKKNTKNKTQAGKAVINRIALIFNHCLH